MGGSIPLPALDVKPPQQPDVMGDMSKLMAMRGMMNQQQSQQQEMQLRQQQIQDEQATTAAMKNWDGKDYDQLSKAVLQNGGSANAATSIQQHGLTIKKMVSDIAKQDAETGSKKLETFIGVHKAIGDGLLGLENVPDDQLHARATALVQDYMKNGLMDSNTGQQALAGVQSTPDPQSLRDHIDVFAKAMMGAKAVAEQAQTQANTRKTNAEAGAKEQELNFYKQFPNAGAPGVPAETVQMGSAMKQNPTLTPGTYPAYKAGQEAAVTQPFKIQTAQAEAQTRMAMEGMAKPVYAFDPKTNAKDLMSQTEAIAQGRKVMTPVTAKEVSDDTMLINRLGDVHQKLSEYENALQKPISDQDRGNMAALLGTKGMQVGAFGTELPMERVNAALNRENLAGLSANARDQLVAYRNMREAMTGYTRVLSGSGRSSDKNLELQEQAMPDPTISDADFSRRSLGAFRGNLRVVGQGLPNIPGVKTPEQWEQEIAQPRSAPGPGAFNAPQPFITPSLMSLLNRR
jgi:hypothetical protein